MKGWLVYEARNVSRNRFFIDKWLAAAASRGVALRLVTTEDLCFGVAGGLPFLRLGDEDVLPDFIVMRAPLPLLSSQAESLGIAVYNEARLSAIANDKRETHRLFAGLLPMMDTAFVTPEAFRQPFPYPVVVKGAHGCGGRQVHLAADEAGYQAALSAISPDSAVVQPLCDTPGRDLRVYVLGDQIIGAMLRSSESDFRSNVGLGADSRPVPLPDAVRHFVEIVQSKFRIGLAGIDFIFQKGEPVFSEIEDAVGTRMLYMHTDRDIAADYLDLILRQQL
ncbi:MAG: RimK family alpha-L-glutamate ligase [Christensenellales bacterium]